MGPGDFGAYGSPAEVLRLLADRMECGPALSPRVFQTVQALVRQVHDLALPPTGFESMVQVSVGAGDHPYLRIEVNGHL